MKKELFETAELEVIEFEQSDVILTSLDEYEGNPVTNSVHLSLF